MALEAIRLPMEAVISSNLEAIGYDPHKKILAVQFKNGSIYHYADLPLEVFAEFYAAESKGRHYNEHIKAKFPGHEMTGLCNKCGVQGWIGNACADCGCGVYVAKVRPAFRKEFIPTRVLLNHEGDAKSADRAAADGVTPDVIFVRNDGWSLGAPKVLEAAARSTWRGHWTEQWKRKGSGWEQSWPLPGDDPTTISGPNL